MNDILNKNLILFKKYHCDISLPHNFTSLNFETYNNLPFKIFFNNQQIILNSKYNPLKEIERQFEKDYIFKNKPIIFFGFGFGFILKFINSSINFFSNKIIIIEPFPEIFFTALNITDFSNEEQIIKNITFIISDSEEKILKKLFSVISLNELNTVNFIIHKPTFSLLSNKFNKIKSIIEQIIENKNFENKFGSLMENNYLTNKKFISSSFPISDFIKQNKNKFEFGFLISAGPSLDFCYDVIKKLKSKNSIIASVDAALIPLLENSINPDFVLSIDPQHYIFDFYNYQKEYNFNLIFSLLSSPDIHSFSFKKKFYFVPSQHFVISKFNDYYEADNFLNGGGAVSTYLLELLIKLNCKSIYFFGQDFSFPFFYLYSKYSAFYRNAIHSLNKFNSIETINFTSFINFEYLYFNNLYTSKTLLSYKKEFENLIRKNNHISFFNVNSYGLNIIGSQNIFI